MRVKLRAALLLALALAPSAYLAWTWRAMPQLGLHHDDGVYLVSAKSLAEGHGYRIDSLPDSPFQTKYPPLTPALLAVAWKLGAALPDKLQAVALLAWLMLPLSLFVMRATFRSFGLGSRETWLLTILAATHPLMCVLSTTVMSDLLFLFLFLASMLLAEKALDQNEHASLALAAGLVAGLAYLTRTAALPIALTSPLCFLYRRQGRRAILFLCGMLPAMAAWQVWTSMHIMHTSDPALVYYTTYLGLQLATVHAQNLAYILWCNMGVMWPSMGSLVLFDIGTGYVSLQALIAAAAILGAVRLARGSGRLHYPAAAAVMSGGLLAYHYTPDDRLCLPLFALILMGFWTEMKRFYGAVQAAWRRDTANRICAAGAGALLAAGAVLIVAAYAKGDAVVVPQLYAQRRSQLKGREAGYEWLRAHTAPESKVYAYDDPVLFLYTGRRALGLTMPFARKYHDDPDGEAVQFALSVPEQAREHRLDYLFLTKNDFDRESRTGLTLRAAVGDPRLSQEFAAGDAVVYRCLP